MGYGFGGTLAIYHARHHPAHYHSISALAPWLGYHGSDWYCEHLAHIPLPGHFDPNQWYAAHPDAPPMPLWIDQGLADDHLGNKINLDTFKKTVAARIESGEIHLHRHKRYDHSFYFVHSHIREHLVFHSEHHDL